VGEAGGEWQAEHMTLRQRFCTAVRVDANGRTTVPIPFDPDEVWGAKSRHPVHGSIADRKMRGYIETKDDRPVIVLGPTWTGEPLEDGEEVEAVLEPEGPQRADLAPDIAAALAAAPDAAAFFDSLAQFYRKGWLTWIDSTKRNPEQRPVRITAMVQAMREGRKQRE
jgi:hypothetical protein